MLHDAPAEVELRRFVARKGGGDHIFCRERVAQRARIEQRLARAAGDVRPRDERRVAHQRHAPMAKAR